MLRDWTDSDKVDPLSAESERFFVRLIMKADDYGRYHGECKRLKAFLFPLKPQIRDTDISLWIAECVKAGLIRRYEDGQRAFLEIANFGQRLRTMKSVFPTPSDTKLRTDDGGLRTDDGGLRTDDRKPPPEGKRREVEEEGKGNAHAREASSELLDRDQAIAQTAVSGVDAAFAGYVFDDWHSREGKDSAGVACRWLGYVTKRWNRERKEWSNGTHNGKKSNASNRSNSRPGADRAAGTLNAGKTGQYAGLGKVGGV
jgi:hypothetical protein